MCVHPSVTGSPTQCVRFRFVPRAQCPLPKMVRRLPSRHFLFSRLTFARSRGNRYAEIVLLASSVTFVFSRIFTVLLYFPSGSCISILYDTLFPFSLPSAFCPLLLQDLSSSQRYDAILQLLLRLFSFFSFMSRTLLSGLSFCSY